jgi:hypothetical protein
VFSSLFADKQLLAAVRHTRLRSSDQLKVAMMNNSSDLLEGISFSRYATKRRWTSYWHQLDEVVKLAPKSVLEVGVGAQIFSTIARLHHIPVTTVDIQPVFKPDQVATILHLPFRDGQFDVGATFQTLEHLPIDQAMAGLRELVRVSQRYVIISLPDISEVWRYLLHIPKMGIRQFMLPRKRFFLPHLELFKEHYWEVGRPGFSVHEVIAKMQKQGLACIRTYRVFENPYHRFFILKICHANAEPRAIRSGAPSVL